MAWLVVVMWLFKEGVAQVLKSLLMLSVRNIVYIRYASETGERPVAGSAFQPVATEGSGQVTVRST